jgi:hypothetical protein
MDIFHTLYAGLARAGSLPKHQHRFAFSNPSKTNVNTRAAQFPRFIALTGTCALRVMPVSSAPEWAAPDAFSFADGVSVASCSTHALRKTPPRHGERLASGALCHILATGDSATVTGPYPEILAHLPRRFPA